MSDRAAQAWLRNARAQNLNPASLCSEAELRAAVSPRQLLAWLLELDDEQLRQAVLALDPPVDTLSNALDALTEADHERFGRIDNPRPAPSAGEQLVRISVATGMGYFVQADGTAVPFFDGVSGMRLEFDQRVGEWAPVAGSLIRECAPPEATT